MSFETEGVSQTEANEIVDQAIEDNEVVLFIKGTRIMPQCGYSQKALNYVTQYRDDVECVDVLQSLEEFRAALERHSGWTTIPQAYVDGEFVGGSDVIEELDQRGELAATLEG